MPSTVIKDFQYDHDAHILCITFVSGKIYEYEQVPASIYLGLSTAFSKGTFFNKFTKEQYRHREIVSSES